MNANKHRGKPELTGEDRVYEAAVRGESYRVTPEPTTDDDGFALDDGQSFTVRIVPVSAGGTLHIQAPTIDPEEKARIEVYENASPDGTADDTANDLLVHNQRYDQGVGSETPEATIQRVTNGSLDVSGADQTEHRLLRTGQSYQEDAGPRVFWRTVPLGDDISIRVTDVSGGTANELDFALVLFEGNILTD